jgi:archaemetzincin
VLLPGPDERRKAAGSLAELPLELQHAFTDHGEFEPMPAPSRMDWLSVSRERGQTFESFARATSPWPHPARRRLYLQPLGDATPDRAALLDVLHGFAAAFFGCGVRLLPPLATPGTVRTRRNRFTDVLQLHTRDLLPVLAARVPDDAWGLVGIATDDLYAHDRWSFVFGEAIVGERVGVFSVARYDPRFYGTHDPPAGILLRRACKVLAHETGHLLGMRHCVFFNCVMNGTNHLAESDRRPLHLCPVDLRKLHWSLRFDMIERYERLRAFWRGKGVDDEAGWIERRLALLTQTGVRLEAAEHTPPASGEDRSGQLA